jgi:amino acid transporter
MESGTLIFAVHAVFGTGLLLFGAYRIAVLNDLGGIVSFILGIGLFGLGLFMARRQD